VFFCELETERLFLKNISYADREFILRQFSDESVNAYLFDAEPPTSLLEADAIINFYVQPEPRAQHRWILHRKGDDSKLGTCGFHCWKRDQRWADIGYDLQPQYWGQGYMTEALRAVMSFASREMGLSRIDAHIYAGNTKSIALVRKFNFAFGGETEHCLFRGKTHLHHIYTLIY